MKLALTCVLVAGALVALAAPSPSLAQLTGEGKGRTTTPPVVRPGGAPATPAPAPQPTPADPETTGPTVVQPGPKAPPPTADTPAVASPVVAAPAASSRPAPGLFSVVRSQPRLLSLRHAGGAAVDLQLIGNARVRGPRGERFPAEVHAIVPGVLEQAQLAQMCVDVEAYLNEPMSFPEVEGADVPDFTFPDFGPTWSCEAAQVMSPAGFPIPGEYYCDCEPVF